MTFRFRPFAFFLLSAVTIAQQRHAPGDLSGVATGGWAQFGHDGQRSALSEFRSEPLSRILWQTPVDVTPQYTAYNGSEILLIHYGSPLVTHANTVIVPVKTGADGGFRLDALAGANGSLVWSATTDYILPTVQPYVSTPVFGPALTATRVYFPGAGGTVYFRDDPDAVSGTSGQIAFYGLSNYQASASAYDASVIIDTPLTVDQQGDVYFGFIVQGTTPVPLQSGIARIDATGQGSWVSATSASGDSSMTEVALNSAPALSPDQTILYVVLSNGSSGYLAALNARTLAPMARVLLLDPKSGAPADVDQDSSASPTIGPDGDVYYGVLENPFGANNDRGWLLHFDATLSMVKTPGAFGWDDTASIVPSSMVPSYHGESTYFVMTKYNNYVGIGTGNGMNRIAILDPNATETDLVTGAAVMKEVLTILGPTPDPAGGVKEWCINSAAVDVGSGAVLANSEDGKLYRWDLKTNTFSESIVLTSGLGEAYTPTLIGSDGKVYAINNAILFAVGWGPISPL
jgi:hypothetical protein